MYRKCITVQPCQVENNRTTGIKMKTFICCLNLVMCSSIHTKSSVQTWDTQQSPHTLFFCTVRAGLFHCSWPELAPSLGASYLVWSPLISWILLKGHSSSTVCDRNFVTKMGLGLLCSVKHRTCSVSFWKVLLETGQCSLYQITLSTEKACHLGGFNIKADLPMFYINLILIWRYEDSYCSLSNL